jgi:hypothetical protein
MATDKRIRVALLTLIPVLLCACVIWPGGNDPEGLRVKAEVKSVIEAAKAYRAKYGGYPKSLNLLVPEFLSSLPARAALQYNKSEGVIGFVYSPSTRWGGAAKCTTEIEQVEWVCADFKL